jgi:multiple sugar transport system ATP-binding protein
MARLIIENISKSYIKGECAVKDVTFAAEEGEFIVLVGPSGCGKTTILRMIAGLEDITQGKIYFDDDVVNDILPRDRDVGMVFQNYALYPHMSVFENIAFPLKIRKAKKEDVKQQVLEIADMLNLSEYLKRKPKELSGGQRQRVALGRAIVRNPRIFLFDEPLSNLDAKLRVQMRTEIIKLQKRLGITSVYVTHDQVEAMTMGTRLAVLNNGELQQFDTPEKIYNNPANIFVAGFIGSPQMNFFEGNIETETNNFSLKGDDLILNFNDEHARINLLNDNEIILGIRPENLALSDNSENNLCFDAEIVNIENVGHEAIAYFEKAGKLHSLRTNSFDNISTGKARIKILDIKKIIFFDRDGNSINKNIKENE